MDRVYTYPAYIRGLGWTLVILAAVVWLVLGIVALADASVPVELFLISTVFAAFFGAFGLLVIYFAGTKIKLTKQGISFARGRRRRFVPYADIRSVTHTSVLYTAMLLHTGAGRFAVGKNLAGYPEFVESLKACVPALRTEHGDELCVPCKAWEFYFCAAVFIVVSLGLWSLPLVGLVTGETGVGSLVLFSLVLLPFAVFLAIASLRYPRQYCFTRDTILKTSLCGRSEYPSGNIINVEYGQKKPMTYSRFGIPALHFIHIEFSNKRVIHIDHTSTDFPVEDIAEYVRKYYPIEGKYTEVKLDKRIK